MNYNDKKKYYFIQFDDRITDDLRILGLKKMPGGKAVIYTYLEMLVLAGETKGIIQRNDMFSTIADQIALQLKGISPEEVNAVFAFFSKCGYIAISDDGQSCTFKQAPILTSSQKGGTRRKKLAAIRKDALGTLPPPDDDTGLIADTKNAEEEEKPFLREKKWSHIRAKNATTSSSMRHCSDILNDVMANNAARHHDDDALYTKEQHHHISTDLEEKRTRLIEWGDQLIRSRANRGNDSYPGHESGTARCHPSDSSIQSYQQSSWIFGSFIKGPDFQTAKGNRNPQKAENL